jgi:single-strand DNA-binding protein
MGRITHFLELKVTSAGTSVLNFQIAVDSGYKDKNGNYPTDFFSVTAFKEKAEFVNRHFTKGNLIAVQGRLRAQQYKDKNGVVRKDYSVIVEQVSFTGERPDSKNGSYGGGVPARQQFETFAEYATEPPEAEAYGDEDVPY